MIRLYETNKVRKVQELEGGWDFQPIDKKYEFPAKYEYKMPVPGCWETHPQFLTYSGIGVYRRQVVVSEATSIRLQFKGVSHTAELYWDDKHVAHHYNAYTPFSTVIKDVQPGIHEIRVVVDNSFNSESALHVPNDYYTYGGITRPVVLEHVPDIFIERIQFTPYLEGEQWYGRIAVHVHNIGDQDRQVQLEGSLADIKVTIGAGIVKAQETQAFVITQSFSNIEPWCHENPNLYHLEVQLCIDNEDQPVDDLIERVGFRMVTTNNGHIQVNRADIVLKGFNRHEDHPMAGSALPYQLMVQDLELMIDMGANSVRTSHYPNDERFLDLCDERGMYVWEENHARGLTLEQMQHPQFEQQCEDCNREMVESHVNHPSIIIWAILNECASNTLEGKEMYRAQLEQIRGMDTSRPLSFASHHRDQELCFDLVDIVSFNLYPLWYGDEDPGELCDQARVWADELGGLGKPMMMSEFGGDGYYGLRDPSRVKGTEERQSDIVERNITAYQERSFISGMFIWQFCDCRVTEGNGWLLSRAGTQNSKGIVDRYRRPKLAYTTVKNLFKD